MKWFQHKTDSHRGLTLRTIYKKYGLEGEARFWRLLEMCAEKYNFGDPVFVFESDFIRQSLSHRSLTDCRSFVDWLANHRIINADTTGINWRIEIPKLPELRDNHTRNLQATNKKLTSNLQAYKDIDLNKDKEEKEKINKKEKPNTGVFLSEIENLYFLFYPRKVGKTKGVQKLSRDIKTEQDLADLKKAINNYAKLCVGKDTEYIKHFSTFASCWRDYVDESVVEENTKPIDPLAELKLKLSMKG